MAFPMSRAARPSRGRCSGRFRRDQTTPMGLRRTWFMASSIEGLLRRGSAQFGKSGCARAGQCPRDGRPASCVRDSNLRVIGVGFHHVGDGVQHSGPLLDGPCAPRRCAASAAITASSTSRLDERGMVAITAPSLGFTRPADAHLGLMPRAADGVEHVDGLGHAQASRRRANGPCPGPIRPKSERHRAPSAGSAERCRGPRRPSGDGGGSCATRCRARRTARATYVACVPAVCDLHHAEALRVIWVSDGQAEQAVSAFLRDDLARSGLDDGRSKRLNPPTRSG